MTLNPKVCLLLALLAPAWMAASAQSTYSIPNPLIKPSSLTVQGKDAPSARSGGPEGIPSQGMPNLPPPIPPSMSNMASLPGQSGGLSAPSSETIVRDTLATYTVTAILGKRAVLRNNVGSLQAQAPTAQAQGGGMGQAPSTSSSTSPTPLARQAVVRIDSGNPVVIAGVELMPLVVGSRVEFRLTGKKQVAAVVSLESQSSYGYVPAPNLRDVADPAVALRANPAHTAAGATSRAPAGAPEQGGAMSLPR